MRRFSINEMTTYRWSFEQDVAHYVAAGVPGIGVWRQKLSDYGEEKGIELLAESGLAVSNLLWAGGFTGSDGRTLRESIADAAEAIRLAGEMRAACLVVYTGGRAGHTHSHARRLVRDSIKELLPIAEEFGVTLAIEPMHADCAAEWTFLTTLDESLALVDAMGHPLLKLALDTYHLGLDDSLLERLPAIVPHVAVVHLGDGHLPQDREQVRTPLGEGRVPLRSIVATLQQSGYEGYYDVEIIGQDLPADQYPKLIEQSKAAYADLVAQHA